MRNASYSYTDAGRLAAASGTWGADSYTWDANDNRTRADRTVGGTTASDVATLAPGTNRLAELNDGAGVVSRSFTHTPGGDTASVTRPAAPTLAYSYDARGRLSSVTSGVAQIASYAYDWREQRVSASSTEVGSRHYLYAEDGQLLAEHDATTGALLREYVWLDTMPLAIVSGAVSTPSYTWITSGNLNEPLLLTSASGAVVSSVTGDPWGNPILLAGGQPLDLGYPGQWHDASTGLSQNWHRDYDPTLGRYIEADPLGLGGGSNVFAYVGGDPANITDPMGLESYRPTPIDWFSTGPFGLIAGVRDAVIPAMRGAQVCLDPWELGEDLLIDGSLMLAAGGIYKLGELAFLRTNRVSDGITPDWRTGAGYGAADNPVRIPGSWSLEDIERGLMGRPPRSLGTPDLHHGGQMPGGAKHEILSYQHRGNPALHPNRNQGVTPKIRQSDRQLHWWYRAREQGADRKFPGRIYD